MTARPLPQHFDNTQVCTIRRKYVAPDLSPIPHDSLFALMEDTHAGVWRCVWDQLSRIQDLNQRFGVWSAHVRPYMEEALDRRTCEVRRDYLRVRDRYMPSSPDAQPNFKEFKAAHHTMYGYFMGVEDTIIRVVTDAARKDGVTLMPSPPSAPPPTGTTTPSVDTAEAMCLTLCTLRKYVMACLWIDAKVSSETCTVVLNLLRAVEICLYERFAITTLGYDDDTCKRMLDTDTVWRTLRSVVATELLEHSSTSTSSLPPSSLPSLPVAATYLGWVVSLLRSGSESILSEAVTANVYPPWKDDEKIMWQEIDTLCARHGNALTTD